jgi:hypothetical protein
MNLDTSADETDTKELDSEVKAFDFSHYLEKKGNRRRRLANFLKVTPFMAY